MPRLTWTKYLPPCLPLALMACCGDRSALDAELQAAGPKVGEAAAPDIGTQMVMKSQADGSEEFSKSSAPRTIEGIAPRP